MKLCLEEVNIFGKVEFVFPGIPQQISPQQLINISDDFGSFGIRHVLVFLYISEITSIYNNPCAARTIYIRFNPCAARPVYIRFNSCAARPVYIRFNPCAARPVYIRFNPCAARTVYIRFNPCADTPFQSCLDKEKSLDLIEYFLLEA